MTLTLLKDLDHERRRLSANSRVTFWYVTYISKCYMAYPIRTRKE